MKLDKVISGIFAVVFLILSAFRLAAVEGLQLSVECSNVVLSWPTVDGNNDTYIIQRSPVVTPNINWTCLTNSFPTASGTSTTVFVDSNIVVHPNCDGAGGFDLAFRNGRVGFLQNANVPTLVPNETALPPLPPPLPNPNNTFPNSIRSLALNANDLDSDDDGPGMPLDAGGSSTNVVATDAEFYRVVKVGVHLYGITNGMVLSGSVPLNVEFGNPDTNTTLNSLYLISSPDIDPDGANGNVLGTSFPAFSVGSGNYFAGGLEHCLRYQRHIFHHAGRKHE